MLCSLCKEEKDESLFVKSHYYCKVCNNKIAAIYRAANKEKIKERDRKYRETHLEYLKQKAAEKRNEEGYKEQFKEYITKYRKENKEKIAAKVKEYYKENKEEIETYKQKWKEENPDKIKTYIFKSKPRALVYHKWWEANKCRLNEEYKNGLQSRHRATKLLRPEILNRDNFVCVLCGATKELVVHHIIPVKVDQTKIEDVSNLITLCKECHLHKAHNGTTRGLNEEVAKQLTEIIEQRQPSLLTLSQPVL